MNFDKFVDGCPNYPSHTRKCAILSLSIISKRKKSPVEKANIVNILQWTNTRIPSETGLGKHIHICYLCKLSVYLVEGRSFTLIHPVLFSTTSNKTDFGREIRRFINRIKNLKKQLLRKKTLEFGKENCLHF